MKLLLQEFDTNLTINKDILIAQIEEALNKADVRIDQLKLLKHTQNYKYEAIKIALGNTAEEREVTISPNAGLLNLILGQTDIPKRALDITKFVSAFTREPMLSNEESPFWFYCNKTNTKLLPIFIHTLAITFLKGGNYLQMLDKICATQGTLSEDGDKWVDKHSGYTIKMIELKLSQGAKPGKGGVLPASKLTKELAEIRHVPLGKDVISPAYHSAFSTIKEMVEFIELMASATGLPVGIKSAVGKLEMWEE